MDGDVRRPGGVSSTNLDPALFVLEFEGAGLSRLADERVGEELVDRADPEVAEAGLQTLKEELPPGVGERPGAEQRAVGGVRAASRLSKSGRLAFSRSRNRSGNAEASQRIAPATDAIRWSPPWRAKNR